VKSLDIDATLKIIELFNKISNLGVSCDTQLIFQLQMLMKI
jgi:hypothetical protein